MDPQTFWDALKARGLTFFAGVPDSTFQRAYTAMVRDPDIRYVPAVREECSPRTGERSLFCRWPGWRNNAKLRHREHCESPDVLQSDVQDPGTSCGRMARIWRTSNDAPEHWIMGVKTPDIFDLLEIPYEILEPDNLSTALDRLLSAIDEQSVPGALLVRAGVIE